MKISWLIALFVCGALTAKAETVRAEQVYGHERAKILRQATSCEAQRITVEHGKNVDGRSAMKIVSNGNSQLLKPETLAFLQSALLRDYEKDQASKLCMPTPGVRYLFRSKGEAVSILVCYRCRIVVVEESGQIIRQRDAEDIISDLRKVAGTFLNAEEVSKLP